MKGFNRKKSTLLWLLLASVVLLDLPAFVVAEEINSTKFIPSDTSIGTWDAGTRTYTLSQDVDETIQIDEDHLTLDGGGYSVTGDGSGSGVYLADRTAVTVRNMHISGFSYGIYLYNSHGNTVTQNTASGNSRYGIYLHDSSSNMVTSNTAANNYEGIFLRYSNDNRIMGNATSGNYSGINLYDNCDYNNLKGNTASGNSHGICLYTSSNNAITDNTTNSNKYHGIYLNNNCNSNILKYNVTTWNDGHGIYFHSSSSNTVGENTAARNYAGIYCYYNSGNNVLTENTISKNYYGIYLYYNSNDNEIYNNNFVSNVSQVDVRSSSGNVFSMSAPTGGNFWSDWTTPNADRDTFVDSPYVFANGQDDLPWVRQDAWNNRPPVADAGPGQTSHPRHTVTLDGSGSSDPEEDYPLTYDWQITAKPDGSTVELADADTMSPSFTVDLLGDYTVELIVTDSLGAESTPAQVLIGTYNEVPIADAGPGQTVHPRDVVTLDGSGSSDPEEDHPLSYAWQITAKPDGSTVELADANTMNPSFTVDLLGDYAVELIVIDSLGAESTPAQVLIGTFNTAPVANAGPDQVIIEIGAVVTLDGTASDDPDNDEITYLWAIAERPAGSLAELSDPGAAAPTFVADIHADYVLSLTVTDVFGAASEPDTITVSFENIAPVADAGANQSVIIGDTVFLDGSASSDTNGDSLSYSWSFAAKPAGSLAVIAEPASVQTSFVADETGEYVVSLVVNDSFVDSAAVTVTITALGHREGAIRALLNARQVIGELDPQILKNGSETSDSMINKIDAVLGMIYPDDGSYGNALNKLINDIWEHTNGCAAGGSPDSNDWILTCEGQGQVYPLIMEAIEHLQNLI